MFNSATANELDVRRGLSLLQARNRNACDLDAGVLLTVTRVATRIVTATQLLDFEFFTLLQGLNDFGGHSRTGDHRTTDHAGISGVGQENLIERQGSGRIARFPQIDIEQIALGNADLAAVSLNNREHHSRSLKLAEIA